METMMRETTVTRKWIPSALWIDSGELPSFEARDHARCYSRPYDRSEDGPTDGYSIKYVRADNFDALVAALEDEFEALYVWLSNQNNAKPEVIEGMLISRQKIADVLRQVRDSR
jgi:hypothetical protein